MRWFMPPFGADGGEHVQHQPSGGAPVRLDNRVRRRRQEAVDEVRAGGGLRLGAAVAPELGPDTSEDRQRPIVVQRKPDDILLFGFRIRLRRRFRKAVDLVIEFNNESG